MIPHKENTEELTFIPDVPDSGITQKTKRKRYSLKKTRLREQNDISKVLNIHDIIDRKLLLKKKLNLGAKKKVVQTLKGVNEVAWARDNQYYDFFGTPDVDYVVFLNGAIQTELFIHIVKSRAEREQYIEKLLADEPEAKQDPFNYLLRHKIVILLCTSELRVKEKLAHVTTLLQKT